MKLIDVINSPWAILPEKLQEISEIYCTHLRGDKIDIKGIEARLGEPLNNQTPEVEIDNGVAIVPINGVLGKRMNMVKRISGGTSMQIIENQLKAVMENQEVESIVLDIDSPGGTVDGTFELASFIHGLRGEKPIVALANGMMGSAAYWIGSAADKIYITGETTHVGSIGVIATHIDISKSNEKQGMVVTEITSGSAKAFGSENKPLSEEGRLTMQAHVDLLAGIFVDSVAKFRGLSKEHVLGVAGDGKVFIGHQAIEAGLVDGVSTLDGLINTMSPEVEGESKLFLRSQNDMSKETLPVLTAEAIRSDYPDVYKSLHEASFQAGLEAGKKQEMERIKAVEEQLIPGHEALIDGMKFDGKTTGPEAAAAVVRAEKNLLSSKAKELEEDAEAPVEVSGEQGKTKKEFTKPSCEEDIRDQCKVKWEDNFEGVRNEHMSLESFTAFEVNNWKGRVKIK